MTILINFLNQLPSNNAIAVGEMLNRLSDDGIGFIEDYLVKGSEIPGNIVSNINEAFKSAGYPQFTWNNCRLVTSHKCFDQWFDEV